jgi:hypothetical protein
MKNGRVLRACVLTDCLSHAKRGTPLEYSDVHLLLSVIHKIRLFWYTTHPLAGFVVVLKLGWPPRDGGRIYRTDSHRCRSFTLEKKHGYFVREGYSGPPLWSTGQSSWLQFQRSRVRFPELPDILRSSGCGAESTQPREDNWGATRMKSSGLGLENRNEQPLGPVALPTRHPSITEFGTNFTGHMQLLRRYSSHAD